MYGDRTMPTKTFARALTTLHVEFFRNLSSTAAGVTLLSQSIRTSVSGIGALVLVPEVIREPHQDANGYQQQAQRGAPECPPDLGRRRGSRVFAYAFRRAEFQTIVGKNRCARGMKLCLTVSATSNCSDGLVLRLFRQGDARGRAAQGSDGILNVVVGN